MELVLGKEVSKKKKKTNCGKKKKTHNTKFTIFTSLNVPFSGVNYFLIVAQWNSGIFSTCKTKTLYLPNNCSLPLLPAPENTILFSVSLNLTTLSASYERNHSFFCHPVPGLFHGHNILKLHPCCSM